MHGGEYSQLRFFVKNNNFIGLNPDCKKLSIQIIKFVFKKINKTPKSILPTEDLKGIIINYKHRNNIMKIEVYKFYINVSLNDEKIVNCIRNYFENLEFFLWKLIN